MKRITYRLRGEDRHGQIVTTETMMGATYYRVRNDASGLIVSVLPQWIVTR